MFNDYSALLRIRIRLPHKLWMRLQSRSENAAEESRQIKQGKSTSYVGEGDSIILEDDDDNYDNLVS